MLEVKNLACVRAGRVLFAGVSFALAPGETLYVRGANGTGKTTLLRVLCGLFAPDEGEVLWRGEAIGRSGEAFLRGLLYLGHQSALKRALSPLQNLRFAAALGGVRVGAAALRGALERVGLDGFADVPCAVLSPGQQRRVAVARLLLSDAPLWVLDEPATALDSAATAMLRGLIAAHVGRGGMVALTAHGGVALASGAVKDLTLGEAAPGQDGPGQSEPGQGE